MPYGNEARRQCRKIFNRICSILESKRQTEGIYFCLRISRQSRQVNYTSSGAARIQWWEAGLKARSMQNHLQPDYEWTAYIEKDKPTVSHEIGQWCVYPDFKEMSKYDGVLKPKNYEIFQRQAGRTWHVASCR